MPDHCIYNLYAEGIRPKSKDSLYDGLRSVSVEFECIDQIYEKNILAGIISDAEGEFLDVIKKLRMGGGSNHWHGSGITGHL